MIKWLPPWLNLHNSSSFSFHVEKIKKITIAIFSLLFLEVYRISGKNSGISENCSDQILNIQKECDIYTIILLFGTSL